MLVMKVNSMAFPDARRWLESKFGTATTSASQQARQTHREGEPSGLTLAGATALVNDAAERLWRHEGAEDLAYLRSRGLADETIRAARLGWTKRADGVPWKPPGVVIPWFEGDRLTRVKIRPPEAWRLRFPEDKGRRNISRVSGTGIQSIPIRP